MCISKIDRHFMRLLNTILRMSKPAVRSYDPAFKEIGELAKLCEEKGIDQEITARLKKAVLLTEARDAYCDECTTTPSPALQTLQTETMTYPFQKVFDEGKTMWNLNPRMMSGHLEGKFLQGLVSMANAKHILEIGMFTGYAALACAEVVPEDGTVTTCEIDPFLDQLTRDLVSKSPHGKKIDIKIGPAMDTLEQMIKDKRQFDFVFIDAEKPGYIDYFKTVVDRGLLGPRGTVVFDNMFMNGGAYRPNEVTHPGGPAIRKVNEYLKTRDDIFKVLVPIRDGVVIARRKTDTFT